MGGLARLIHAIFGLDTENPIKEMHCFLTSQKSLSALKKELKRRGVHAPRLERKIKAGEIRHRPQIASSGVVRPQVPKPKQGARTRSRNLHPKGPGLDEWAEEAEVNRKNARLLSTWLDISKRLPNLPFYTGRRNNNHRQGVLRLY